MGDDCNVTSRRGGESPRSSSPTLGARVKDLEDRRSGEIPMEEREKEPLIRSRPESGEPGEDLGKISIDKHGVGSDLHEVKEHQDVTNSYRLVPQRPGYQAVPAVFPFSETKLRPDAPPFTPESLARVNVIPAASAGESEGISDSVSDDESSRAPQPEIDDSCFVSVDLRSPDEQQLTSLASKQRAQGPPSIRDSRDVLKDPGLKPFSLASAPPRLKRSPPKIDLSVDSLRTDVEMNEMAVAAVVAESGANDPDIRDTGPETGEPRQGRRHWRIFRTAFVVGNRIQIAVFIASIVLCVVIVAYTFV